MQGVTIIQTEQWEQLNKDMQSMKALLSKIASGAKDHDPIMTSKEVQEYLKKGATWVDENKHKIGCSKVGGEWRFRKSVVDEFINQTYHRDR